MKLSLSPEEREIIVIDDGSDLSPLMELQDLCDDLIYLRQPNRGVSEARNMGIRVASGDYIQFVDGDDKLITAPYEHCLDLVRYHNPDIVVFQISSSENQKTSFNFDGPMSGGEYMRNHNLHGTACGMIFKRSILGELRFTPNTRHEDEEFVPLLMLRAERLFLGDCAAYYYRKRSGSFMHTASPEHYNKRLSDMEHVILRLNGIADTLPTPDRLALQRRVAQLTMDYLYNTIRFTHSRQQLDETMSRLKSKGLYPLPDKKYTRKYQFFRKTIDTRIGREMMLLLLR
jgi:glycosyltransferase involved in cell wall biosynthesis